MTLVVGYGNTLRGEDGFGIEVANLLQHKAPEVVEVATLHQLIPELALRISEAGRVIFVDAACGAPEYALAVPLENPHDTLSHHLTPQEVVAMSRLLYDWRGECLLFSMMSLSFDCIADPERYHACVEATAGQILAGERA